MTQSMLINLSYFRGNNQQISGIGKKIILAKTPQKMPQTIHIDRCDNYVIEMTLT